MITFENVKYSEGWNNSPDFVGEVMSFTIRDTNCRCDELAEYMNTICIASDSRQPIRMCWCPECRDERKEYGIRKARETKELAYLYS
jgi:hypothetical protein